MAAYQLAGLEIFVDPSPGMATVALSGELDLANVALLEHVLAGLCDEALFEVIVDLTRMRFLGVCGINALLKSAVHLRSAGREVRIENADPVTLRALNALDLDWLLGESDPTATAVVCSMLMCEESGGADCPHCPPGHHYCRTHSHHPDHGLFDGPR